MAATVPVTWILGLALLMPGISVNWLAYRFHVPETYGAVLVGDGVLYSVLAVVPVMLMTRKMKDHGLLRKAAALTVLVFAVLLMGWLGGRRLDQNGWGICRNEIRTEVKSPDGASKAVIFERDCGATTATALELSIFPSNRIVNHADVANTFSADGNHGASSLQDVQADWTSNDELHITYPAKARVFSQEKRVGNVRVSYTPR